MHIAYLCLDPGIPLFGHKGASNHVREFTGALAALGHQVSLVAARLGEGAGELPCNIYVVPGPPEAGGALEAEAAELRRNSVLGDTLDRINGQTPFDLIYQRYSLWSFEGLECAHRLGVPYVLEVNSPLRIEQLRYRSLYLEPAARAIEVLLFRSATLVAGVSQSVVDYVTREIGRVGPSVVLPNGVDLDLFRSVPAVSTAGAFTVGFVGSLKPWHGLEPLLEAFSILARKSADSRLLIVGDGPQRSFIEQFAAEHDLRDRIRLTGAVAKSRIPELLAAMDVAVAPYPRLDDFYFSPLKVFEYMAAGCAIVASRIGQIPDILSDGHTALLTVPGDALDLAAKIRRLWSDADLRRRLGAAARQEAFLRHGWESRARAVLDAIFAPAEQVLYAR